MILQALHEYYLRKAADSQSVIAPEGMERKEIPFIIVIDAQGNFIDFQDTRDSTEDNGKKTKKGKSFLVPKSVGRSGKNSWQTAFLLWDHFGYVLAHPKSESDKDREMAHNQNTTFINKIKELPDNVKNQPEIQAVLKFYEKDEKHEVFEHQNWKDCAKISGCNMSFKIAGDRDIIPEKEFISSYIRENLTNNKIEGNSNQERPENKNQLCCLITGKKSHIAELHTATAIFGAKSGAKLVGFQKNSGYDSYGKEKGFNAPISVSVESAYTTALKELIKSENNKYLLCGSTFIFWSEKQTDFENDFSIFFDPPKNQDDPDKAVKAVKSLYEALHTGKFNDQEKNYFYLLGLSPNAARISVRFWKRGTVKDFAEKIKQHFDDFQIIQRDGNIAYFPLRLVLQNIALNEKDDKIPPNLAGDMVRSIIEGLPYPAILLNSCINRIRAEQSRKNKNGKPVDNVNCIRASILKAYINRQIRRDRFYNKREKELLMSLDRENKSISYRLGRLFATLEKIQKDASSRNLNSTIRDRFYSAASSSPASVLPSLIRLMNTAHFKKLNRGQQINYDNEICEIMDGIPPKMPAHLNLNEQATFAVGYYHQKQSFYLKK